MEDLFEDFDWKNDAHKILLGVASFFVARWFYDRVTNGSVNLPSSDNTIYNQTISLSQQGAAGVYETLAVMAQLVRRDAASRYLRDFVIDLVGRCSGHDAECEIARCFEYARTRIIYRRDPSTVERVADAKRTIESGVGDCDDKAVLLCSLLAVIGYRTRFVICGFKPRSYSHVYCEVLTKRGWVALDPTPETAIVGWEQKHAPYREVFEIFN